MMIRPTTLVRSVPSTAVKRVARREGIWLYGYGAFQGAASAADSFILFFAAGVLGATAVSIGLVDALSNLGYTLGAVAIAFLMQRFPNYRALLVFFLGAVSVPLFLFSVVHSLVMAFALAAVMEFLWAPIAVLAPVVATQTLPRARWPAAFSRLSQFGALGGAAGVVFSSLWLALSRQTGQAEVGERFLFIIFGAVALFSAFFVHSTLPASTPLSPGRASWASRGRGLVGRGAPADPQPSPLARPAGGRPRLLSEQLLWYYLLSFVLFVGLGMSFSGLHTYMVRDLRLPLAAAMAAVFGFRIAIYLASKPAGRGVTQVMPLQTQSLAILGRALLVALLALMGFLLPATLAFPAVLAVVSLWGAFAAVLNVTGMLVATRLAPPQRKGQAISLYIAVINAAAILGAWLAGALGGGVGFEPMFLLSSALMAGAALLLLRA